MPGTRWADQIEPEPIHWLKKDMIPRGGLVVVAGAMGWGKSTLMARIAAEVSQKEVVWFSPLEDQDATQPRLIAAGANLRNIAIADADEPIQLPDDIERLEAEIKASRASLVIVDPVAAHFRSPGLVNDRRALTPLTRMLRRVNCAMVAVHHIWKSVPGNLDARLAIGGHDLAAASRLAFVFGPDPDDGDQRVMACAKCNWAEKPKSTVYEIEQYEFRKGKKRIATSVLEIVDVASEITAEAVVKHSTRPVKAKSGGSAGKRGKAMEFLATYLSRGPRPATEVFEDALQFGFSERTVKRAKAELQVQSDRIGFGKDSFVVWRLPEGHPALTPELPGSNDGGGQSA